MNIKILNDISSENIVQIVVWLKLAAMKFRDKHMLSFQITKVKKRNVL